MVPTGVRKRFGMVPRPTQSQGMKEKSKIGWKHRRQQSAHRQTQTNGRASSTPGELVIFCTRLEGGHSESS